MLTASKTSYKQQQCIFGYFFGHIEHLDGQQSQYSTKDETTYYFSTK